MTHTTLPLWDDATPDERLDKLRAMIADLYRYQIGASVERIVNMLEAHPCADEKEAADARRIIALCRAHPDILSPLCEVGHITGSALVVHPASRRVLLNHHRKFNFWMQFGGHMEHELDPAATALREAREESGLSDLRFYPPIAAVHRDAHRDAPRPFDVDVHPVPQRGDRPAHLHLDLRYLLATDRPEQAQPSQESNAVRWFGFDELDALDLEPGVWRMIRKVAVLMGAAPNAPRAR